MNEIIIRQALPGEAELIADLSRQTFFDTFARFNTEEDMNLFMEKQFSKESLVEQVRKGDGIFLLATWENRLVGYARLKQQTAQFLPASSLEISRIYAVQDVIGKGVGKSLMEASIELARTHHHQLIWLGVWEKNERAIRFYQNWGFRKAGEQTFILGKDIQTDWIMVKELSD